MPNNLKFSLPDEYDEQLLISALGDHYAIKKQRSVFESLAIYDTFDWRLFNQSLVLSASENKLALRRLFESAIIHSIKITSPPVFIWNFPDSKLKEHLAPIIKMRALIKLAEVYYRSIPYRILNLDEKTVARLVYEEMRPSRTKNAPVLATYLGLKPVMGYPKDTRNLANRLEEAGFKISPKEDLYFKALEAVNKNPGSYSTKLKIELKPDMRSDEATRAILRFLLQVMRINEANIEKDLDTEFLHDFRVAIRRTRSALGQIKNVFPVQTTERFKKDFAFVGKLSNQLRDLDVYLLKESTYKAMLPDVLRDDIEPLFDYLRKKRSKVLQEVTKGLKSKEYLQILRDWEKFLNAPRPDSATASKADRPVIDLARKKIYKKYRSIVKAGSMPLGNAEDDMLHALRIECKKLRYLIEFFASLFSRKKIDVLIEQLKQMQDNLGYYNDLRVQEKYLLNITAEIPKTGQQSKKVLVAIGSLIGTLGSKKQKVKETLGKTFTDFTSATNDRLFRELFALR